MVKGGTISLPYLEIYPIENCADKIAKQLDSVLEAKPNMYAKTRERYKRLAYSLLQSVEKISNILEEETLIPSSSEYGLNEFNELSSSENADDSVSELSNALDSVKHQVDSYSEFTHSSSKLSNKDIVSKFASVLKSASSADFSCKEVSQCARILCNWFYARFVPNHRNPKFRYNIKQIPNWICYIVILYGKYHSFGKADDFEKLMSDWCLEITSDWNNIYAVPYEVFEMMKYDSIDPKSYTMNAVLVWDLLLGECLYELSEFRMSGSSVFLDVSSVPNIVKDNNLALVPEIRTRIANRSSLIDKYNLTRVHVEEGDSRIE